MKWIFPTAFSSWRHGDGSSESAAIDRVLASGQYTAGPEVEALEEEFARYHDRRHCIMVNSGSSANEVAMATIAQKYYPEWYEGSEEGPRNTSVPSIAWSTTYAPCRRHGYGIFDICDADNTWNSPLPKLIQLKEPRGSWSDMLIVCPILGNPLIEYDKIVSLKEESPSVYPVLEDCCESLGARTSLGQLCGTFGDLSTFSFFYSHQLSAIEGGAILTDDDELARLCRLLCNHGNAGWGKSDIEKQYDFRLFGYNVRPIEMHAAVAREQLKKLDEMIDERRKNLIHFRTIALHLPITLQAITPGSAPSPFGLAFTCESRAARNRLATALKAEGIDCRMPTGGSFLKHAYGEPWCNQATPNADRIHDTGMFLGNAPWPIPRLIDKAIAVMRKTL